MPTTTPDGTVLEFAERLGAGDLKGALALYEDDAVLLPEPGTVLRGRAALREGLAGYIAIRPRLTTRDHRVLATGDVALVVHAWELSAQLPDGARLEQRGSAADVLRRQADGSWLFAVDDPWGTSLLDQPSGADPAAAPAAAGAR